MEAALPLPSGTVTFLFTDIEGSTRLLHALGPDAYADALAEHRRALREAFTAHGGVEVDTQGDAFFVAFPTAAGAAEAARMGTEVLAPGPIRVRMGLHTGTPTLAHEGYVGVDVHRGARMASLAHGGQIVLSPATAALLDGESLRDVGLHRLKDFDGATRLFQLGDGQFPPLRTPGSVDLPTPATRFLGRERELFDAVSLVLERDPRVLTVVGPGGTGKTRFALELARLLAEEAVGGTVFVALSPLRDPALALTAVADALGAPGGDAGVIAARVGDKRTHVVVDNAEHLLPGIAPPLAKLVAAAPALRFLATSREPLRISGEVELDLPPLVESEAVALFLERARAVRPDVEATAAVVELCERLDRLPLALELAAARTKLLAPDALLERLADRLDVLKGTRDADARHATLRATIAWSHDLLDDDEKALFARLAVFRGGCTLEAAEEVCGADVETVASLLDKSLLRRRAEPSGVERYWMLETIREFAVEQLEASTDSENVRRRHAERLLDVARDAHLTAEDFVHGSKHEVVYAELDEVRAALDWAFSHDRVLAAALFVSLEQVWATHLHAEGRQRVEPLLDDATLPSDLRARILRVAGGIVIQDGELELGEQRYREALSIFDELGDEYNAVGLRARFAVHAGWHDDSESARRLVAEVRAANERVGNPIVEPQMLSTLATLSYRERDWERARELYCRSIEAARECGFTMWELWETTTLLEVDLERGALDDAERSGRIALELARRLRDRERGLWALAGLSRAAFERGDVERAGMLWGAVSEDLRDEPLSRFADDFAVFTAPLAEVAEARFLAAVEQGCLRTVEEAVAIALGEQESAQTVP
jgi:predicted ATPase/class 3 adenylate cyclase